MAKKPMKNQEDSRRMPQQERAQHKVELMLEAAMQLLETGGIEKLTTNAVAAKAGVSIGTLYQYFGSKSALVDALVTRELGAIADKITSSLQALPRAEPGDRIRTSLRAVTAAYGGRNRVHRLLIEHASTSKPVGRLSPLYAQLIDFWTREGVVTANGNTRKLTAAEAFVLTYAAAGVLRSMAALEDAPPAQELEDALVRLFVGFVTGPAPE
jgi:AcrR family transcriptional regulator